MCGYTEGCSEGVEDDSEELQDGVLFSMTCFHLVSVLTFQLSISNGAKFVHGHTAGQKRWNYLSRSNIG